MEPLNLGVSMVILSDFCKASSRLSYLLTWIAGVAAKSKSVEEEFDVDRVFKSLSTKFSTWEAGGNI